MLFPLGLYQFFSVVASDAHATFFHRLCSTKKVAHSIQSGACPKGEITSHVNFGLFRLVDEVILLEELPMLLQIKTFKVFKQNLASFPSILFLSSRDEMILFFQFIAAHMFFLRCIGLYFTLLTEND